MIIGSFNVRGLGVGLRKGRSKEFVSSNQLDCLLIQETKFSSVSESLCHYLWGNSLCDWSLALTIGNSGGILSIWCTSKGKAMFSFTGRVLLVCAWNGGWSEIVVL